eukprot:g46420.t1
MSLVWTLSALDVYLAFVVFFAETMYGLTSFGPAIVFVIGYQFMTTLEVPGADGSMLGTVQRILVTNLVIAVVQLFLLRHLYNWSVVRFTSLAASCYLPSVYIGTLLLFLYDGTLIKRLLGGILIGFALFRAWSMYRSSDSEPPAPLASQISPMNSRTEKAAALLSPMASPTPPDTATEKSSAAALLAAAPTGAPTAACLDAIVEEQTVSTEARPPHETGPTEEKKQSRLNKPPPTRPPPARPPRLPEMSWMSFSSKITPFSAQPEAVPEKWLPRSWSSLRQNLQPSDEEPCCTGLGLPLCAPKVLSSLVLAFSGAGIMNGLFSIGGPPMMLFVNYWRKHIDLHQWRAAGNLLRVVGQIVQFISLWKGGVRFVYVGSYALLTFAGWMGLLFGNHLAKGLNPTIFAWYILAFLFSSGVIMVVADSPAQAPAIFSMVAALGLIFLRYGLKWLVKKWRDRASKIHAAEVELTQTDSKLEIRGGDWLPKHFESALSCQVIKSDDYIRSWVECALTLRYADTRPLSILEDMCCTTYPMIRTLRAMT